MSTEAIATVGVALVIIIGVVCYLAKKQFDSILTGIENNRNEIVEQNVKMTESMKKLEENLDKKITEVKTESDKKVNQVAKDLNDLKSDLPMVYTLREDFIRSMNNVESKMLSIDAKIDKLLQR